MTTILKSELLSGVRGLAHGFSTRNLDAFFAELGFSREKIAECDQVHGAEVLTIDRRPDARPTADGMITQSPGLPLGVRTADCAPILIAHVDAQTGTALAVAAVHAGWRGATQKIGEVAVQKLLEWGAKPDSLRVAIGPTIGKTAFFVGEEVIEAAKVSLGGRMPPAARDSDGKWRLDLPGLIKEQLVLLGVPPKFIEDVGYCTVSEPDLFFSYRRDKGTTGRQLSVIGLERRERQAPVSDF